MYSFPFCRGYLASINWPVLLVGIVFILAATALSAQTRLTGRVSDRDGTPLVGANVYVTELRKGDATDADGRYEIADLPPGTYQLRVSYVGYAMQVQPTVIQPGIAKQIVNLQLQPTEFTTETLTITSTRAAANTPVTQTNLDREVLEKNNLGQDVPYLLRWTPATVVTSDAGTGIGYTGIWIRGSDPTRTNITINGIPYNDAESQGVYWVDLPDFASSAEDIQIQRGVGTSTNGTGAFGATINLNTNKVHQEAYTELTGGAGSFGTRRGTLRLGTGLLDNRWSVDARLSKIHSDGYIDRARADLDSWYLSGSYLGNRSVVRFNAFGGHEVTYQAWNGVDASLVDDPVLRTSNTAGIERPGDPYDNEVDDYTQEHYQLLWDRQLTDQLSLHLAGHYTRGKGFYEQYKADEVLADYGILSRYLGIDTLVANSDLIRRRWLDNHFYGTVYSLRHTSRNARWRTTLGGSYNIYEGGHYGEVIWARFAGTSERGQRYYENDAWKSDFSVYLKTDHELTYGLHAYLDMQLRRVTYDFVGIDNELHLLDQANGLTFFNPKAGLWYRISEKASAYASIGVAQREPNRNDYVDNPAAQRPRPEKLYNPELGWQYTTPRSQLSVNAYYMLYRDQLAANGQINDVGELLRTNVDRSYRVGLELVAGTQLGKAWSVQANAAVSRNRVVSFTEYIDSYDADFNWLEQVAVLREDTPLAFSPAIVTGGELTYTLPLLTERHQVAVSLLGKYVGRRHLDLSGDAANTLDPYFFSDLRLRYELSPRWAKRVAVTVLLRNILDNLYETNGWSYRYELGGAAQLQQGLYPQAGRNVLVGVTVGF